MMKKLIKVVVIGETGSGKTAISQVIQNALENSGFDVTFKNLDGDNYSKKSLPLALNAIKEKSSVRISEVQSKIVVK